MTDEIKPEMIKCTQETLAKFIKRPQLTEKLLKKPPFRFLHDVITNIIKETGFLSGLYSISELQSENIKDRDMKIAFLQKLIDCVNMVSEKQLMTKPSKIVAGLEPEKTNELLQAIGYCLTNKLDSSPAVAKIQGDDPLTPKSKTKTKSDKKSLKSKEKTETKSTKPTNSSPRVKNTPDSTRTRKVEEKSSSRVNETPKLKTKDDKSKKESKTAVKTSPRENKSRKPTKEDLVRKPSKEDLVRKPSKEDLVRKPSKEDLIRKPSKEDLIIEPENVEPELASPQLQPEEIAAILLPELVAEKEEIREILAEPEQIEYNALPEPLVSNSPTENVGTIRPRSLLRPPSVRPSSARPGAPRVKDKHEILLPADEIIPMGKVNVIIEDFDTPEDDEDNEETVVFETIPEIIFEEPVIQAKAEIPAEKGHLVAQILEQIEDAGQDTPEITKARVEIEWDTGGTRNRESTNKEMERLRESIQTLTRAANPLGKLISYVQEDVDAMHSELKHWIEENQKLMEEIQALEKSNKEELEPLETQLQEVLDEIESEEDAMTITQANILRNEQKIKDLLSMRET